MIRRAKISDRGDIAKLLIQVCSVHRQGRPDLFTSGRKYSDDEIKRIILDDNMPIFVYEDDGVVLGYAFCQKQDYDGSGAFTKHKTLYIDDLCVDESHRGKKIGEALYSFVVEYAKSNGYYNITLNVWSENKSAMAFYQKMGLKPYKIGMEKLLNE